MSNGAMLTMPGQIACLKPIGRARVLKTSKTRPIFREHKFFLVKKKKPLDLQVFSRLGKTIKKLQWISNTIMNTPAWYLDQVYVSDGVKTALFTHELGNN